MNEQGKGYGIHNIKERLELYYGALGSLEVKVTDAKYTCFTVKMPDTFAEEKSKIKYMKKYYFSKESIILFC